MALPPTGRWLGAALAAALAACSSQQVVLDEERVARRVVELLRQQGLVVRGDGGAAPSRADDPDHPSDEASADEPSEDPADAPEADAPPTTPDPGAARAQALADALRRAQASASPALGQRRVGRARPSTPAPTVTPATVTGAGDGRRVWVPVAGAPTIGPADAPVTIVLFLDLQCPFTARLWPTLLAVRDAHAADVRVVVRHRPLTFHQEAWGAAVLAMTALAQRGVDGFVAAVSYLFAEGHQRELDRASLERHATALGLDALRVADALDAPAPTDADRAIAADDALAETVPVNGTPTMLVNGLVVPGAVPRERVEALVAAELARARTFLARGTRRAALYDTLARTLAPHP